MPVMPPWPCQVLLSGKPRTPRNADARYRAACSRQLDDARPGTLRILSTLRRRCDSPTPCGTHKACDLRAKAADPALADRLTKRTARAADSQAIKEAREAEKTEKNPVRPNARSKRNVGPRCKPNSLRLKAHGGNANWKMREKRAGTPAMLPANRGPSDGNHRPDIGINELGKRDFSLAAGRFLRWRKRRPQLSLSLSLSHRVLEIRSLGSATRGAN